MEQSNRSLLEAGLQEFGLKPSPEQLDAIVGHLAMVADWNQRVNLTALKDERDMVIKHAIDSATVVEGLGLAIGTRVLDVGTGAGFPGIVLKCLCPGIDLVLLESLAKRCKFLEAVETEVVAPLLGTQGGYRVVWGRAEDQGQDWEYREQFDVVIARAVAELRVLSEYCLPFCRVGGKFVAMKGPAAAEEISAAQVAVKVLGGEIESVREVMLPEGAGIRSLISIRKVTRTPKAYPRQAGTPSKNPL